MKTQKSKSTRIIIGGIALLVIAFILLTSFLVYMALTDPGVKAALQNLKTDAGNMFELQRSIRAEFPAQGIRVGIFNGDTLTVTLVNSKSNDLPKEEQEAQAKEIAAFAKNHYSGIGKINFITVGFTRQTGVGGFSMTSTQNYSFKIGDLP